MQLLRRIGHILASRTKSLNGIFRELFGDAVMPKIVHDRDGARQELRMDGYCSEDDMSFMKGAHCEMRLLLALLLCVVTSNSNAERSTESVDRRFIAAALLRDLLNSMLQELAGVQPDDASLCMPGIVLGRECLAVTNKCHLTDVEASRELSGLPCWARFRKWWNDCLSGVGNLDLPCEILQSPARVLVCAS